MSFLDRDEPPRPQIWAEGRQHPKFELRSFALASVMYSRESLAGLFKRCATSAAEFGSVVATGRYRVPQERLGRTGRYLPSTGATARAIQGGADLLWRAARVALPDEDEVPQIRSIFDATPQDVTRKLHDQVKPPAPAACPAAMVQPLVSSDPEINTPDDDPDLAAIKALMASAEAAPRRPRPVQVQALAEVEATAPEVQQPVAANQSDLGWRREWLTDRMAAVLGYGLLIMSVPVGAVLAGLAHLNGEDLRKRVNGEA